MGTDTQLFAVIRISPARELAYYRENRDRAQRKRPAPLSSPRNANFQSAPHDKTVVRDDGEGVVKRCLHLRQIIEIDGDVELAELGRLEAKLCSRDPIASDLLFRPQIVEIGAHALHELEVMHSGFQVAPDMVNVQLLLLCGSIAHLRRPRQETF